jgi:DNA-binding GntR family transcriptional regulator
MSRIWFLPHWQFHDFGLTGSEHEALFNAIEARQPAAAEQAMKEHVESLRRRIMDART